MKKGTGWKLGTIALAGTMTVVTATLAGVGGVALNIAGDVLPSKPKNLALEDKIDYIALGDSYTSGYNAFMGEDYVSFADFFAADLQNADRLGTYKNFSKKSNLIFDIMNKSVLAGDVREALLNADVITITAGANDLVKLLEIAGMSLPSMHASHEYGEVIDENINNGYPTGYDQKVSDAVIDLAHKIAEQNFAGMMNVDETIYKDLYLAVTLNLTLLTTEIAKLAPGAQIILLSPMDPLPYMPKTMLNSPMPGNDGMSFNDVYAKLMDTYDNIAKLNPAVRHINMGEIDDYKSNNETLVIDGMTVQRKHSHNADVNPSTFGHELIGNGLFRIMAPEMGIDFDLQNLAHGRSAELTGRTGDVGSEEDTDFGPESGNEVMTQYSTTPMGSFPWTQKVDENGEPVFWKNTGAKRWQARAMDPNLPPQGQIDYFAQPPVGTQELNIKEEWEAANLPNSAYGTWNTEYWPVLEKCNPQEGVYYSFSTNPSPVENGEEGIVRFFNPEYIDEMVVDGIVADSDNHKNDLVDDFLFKIVKNLIDTETNKTDITSFLAAELPKIVDKVFSSADETQYFTLNDFELSAGGAARIGAHKIFTKVVQGKDPEPVWIDVKELTKSFQVDGVAADLLAILQLLLASATQPEFDSINKMVDNLVLTGTYRETNANGRIEQKAASGELKAIQDAIAASTDRLFLGTDTTIGGQSIATLTNGKATNVFQVSMMMTVTLLREMMSDQTGVTTGFNTVFKTYPNQDGSEQSPYWFWISKQFASNQNVVTSLIQKYGLKRSREMFKDFGVQLTDEQNHPISIDKYFDELLVAFDGNELPFTNEQGEEAVAKMLNPDNTVKNEFKTVEAMANALDRNLDTRMYELLAN